MRALRVAKTLGLAASFVLARPAPSAPESLTLTTYYPAPYGVYQEMRATRSVSFAFEAPSYKVGIGTTQPGSKLSVKGAVSVGDGYDSYKQGADTTGNPTAAPAGWASAPNPDGLIVKGRLGVGTPYPAPGDPFVAQPAYALDVVGGARFTKNIYVNQLGACVPRTPSAGGGTTLCSAGYYATWTPGFYSKGTTYVGMPSAYQDLVWGRQVQMGANVTFMCCRRTD
ncbi:MAG: hypothetical protein WC728_09830 [Elusimicrobiota bacterium]